MDKIDFYFKVLARYDQYIQLANTKASNHITLLASILAANTALVGWGINIENVTLCTVIIGFLYVLFLYRCFEWYSSCMKVIDPNRKRNSDDSANKNDDDLSSIFYSDISKFCNFEDFKSQVHQRNENQHLDDLIHQVFIMAKITEKKFDDYQSVNKHVIHSVMLSILILLVTVINKIGG